MQRVNTIKWFAEEPANFEHGIGEYGSMCKQSLKEIDSKMCAFVKKKKFKYLYQRQSVNCSRILF